jgi:hypothetical protein
MTFRARSNRGRYTVAAALSEDMKKKEDLGVKFRGRGTRGDVDFW